MNERPQADSAVKRNRIKYAAFILTVILLGLASRAYSPPLPSFVREYVGDALWALTAYLTVAFLFPRLPVRRVALAAGLFSLTVELSQLYQAPWIDRIRQIRLAALVLGHGFLWSDLVCYGVGICTGVFYEISRLGLSPAKAKVKAKVKAKERGR